VLVIVLHELALPLILLYFVCAVPAQHLRLKLTGQSPPAAQEEEAVQQLMTDEA
jgi:hypothetical protein